MIRWGLFTNICLEKGRNSCESNTFCNPICCDFCVTEVHYSDEELETIIAHELGHLRESLATRWKRMSSLLVIGIVGLLPPIYATFGITGYLISIVAAVLFSRLRRRHSRALERVADVAGHTAQRDDQTYARALEKLHIASLIPAVLHKHATHPSLYDRMIAAGVTPDYPRPKPPKRWLALLLGALATVSSCVGILVMTKVLAALARHA